jgi:hypothetical protein
MLGSCTPANPFGPATSSSSHVTNSPNGPTARLLAKDRAAVLAEYPDANIPKTRVIRTITLTETPRVMADCYTANGVPSVVEGDAVRTKINGQAEDEKAQIVRIICDAEYPLMDKYNK